MRNLAQMLREGRHDEAWIKYCGFIDLSLSEFMQIQERLLKEQIQLLCRSTLGKKLLRNQTPHSLEEFRQCVPLTSYEDYLPYLSEKREEALPVKPKHWVCTSGKLGQYDRKWAPYPEAWGQTHIKNFLASIIFSTCSKRGEINLKESAKFLYAMAPPPYLTGMVPYGLKDEFPFEYLPPLSEAERMTFDEQNREGFRLGLNRGIDLFFGLSVVLTRIGEKFAQRGVITALGLKALSPMAWVRLTRGYIKSKLEGREFLPKDGWNVKGIICAGTDTTFYKDRIEYYWGKKPLEVYGGTEIGIAATQTWDHEGMVLFPDANFWEFIPEAEHAKWQADPEYQPVTVLAPELEPGKRYELVVTNFQGGAFVRYRVGDMIKVLARRNDKLDIDLPQVIYEDRVEDVIDLASFTRITERTLWEALRLAGLTQRNWIAHKAFSQEHPVVELFLEMPQNTSTQAVEDRIHESLRSVNEDYKDLEEMMGYRPLRVIAIPEGRLKAIRERHGQGGHSWNTAPESRINPPEEVLAEVAVSRDNTEAV